MKKNVCLCVLALSLVATGLSANDEIPHAYDEWPGALGLFVSSLATNPGYGIHYHYSFGRLGVSATLGGYYDPGNKLYSDQVLYYSIFSTLQYRVYGHTFSPGLSTQLYSWVLGGHIGSIDWVEGPVGSYTSVHGPYKADFVAGLGIGIELIFRGHLSIPLEFGYVGQFPNDKIVSFTFASGVRYRF